ETRPEQSPEPADRERGHGSKRAQQRATDELDAGPEHEAHHDERDTSGDGEVEVQCRARRAPRQPRGEQPGDGEEAERENRIHKGVRSRTLDARARRAVACFTYASVVLRLRWPPAQR